MQFRSRRAAYTPGTTAESERLTLHPISPARAGFVGERPGGNDQTRQKGHLMSELENVHIQTILQGLKKVGDSHEPTLDYSDVPKFFADNQWKGLDLRRQRQVFDFIGELMSKGVLRASSRLGEVDGSAYGSARPVAVTEYGRDWLQASTESPVHRSYRDYVAHLKAKVPAIDSVVCEYAAEANVAYWSSCYRAAMTMLGCASEKLVLLLCEQLVLWASRPPSAANLEKALSKNSIKLKHDELMKCLKELVTAKALAKSELDNSQPWLDYFFDCLRRNRNAAGHPTGITTYPADVHAALTQFPTYVVHLYALKDKFV